MNDKSVAGKLASWTSLFWRGLLTVSLALLIAFVSGAGKARAGWPLAQWPTEEKQVAAPESPEEVSDAVGLQQAVAGIAERLEESLENSGSTAGLLADGIVVCSFVELKKFNRTSSFGRYLAEQLISEMQQRQYMVVEYRQSEAVFIQDGRGEFGLSREPAKISGEAAAGAMLTGTYTITPDEVMVNARIVDNRNHEVLASAATVVPRTVLVSDLLADAASVRKKAEPEFIYMKRLP